MQKPAAAVALLFLLATCLAMAQRDASKPTYTIYQVGGDVKAPRPISTPVPAPPDSVDKGLKVHLSFVVMPDGSVSDIRLLKRSRSDLDDFAVSVVGKWTFEPATKAGRPVAVRIETDMNSHR